MIQPFLVSWMIIVMFLTVVIVSIPCCKKVIFISFMKFIFYNFRSRRPKKSREQRKVYISKHLKIRKRTTRICQTIKQAERNGIDCQFCGKCNKYSQYYYKRIQSIVERNRTKDSREGDVLGDYT